MVARALLLATAALASGATAADLPPIAFLSMGYHELRRAEATGVPGPIALSGDLTGDGRAGEARILIDDSRADARVVVVARLQDHLDTYVIDQADARTGRGVRLRLLGRAGRPAIRVEHPDGSTLIFRFDGEEFRPVSAAAGTTHA